MSHDHQMNENVPEIAVVFFRRATSMRYDKLFHKSTFLLTYLHTYEERIAR